MRKVSTENEMHSTSTHHSTNRLNNCAKSRFNRLPLTILSSILIAGFATNSFANRPSMEEREAEATNDVMSNTPSSVEIMMQQQTQQTGDVLNLPAQEIQPGEVIKIKLLDQPRRGTSMAYVKQELGEPITISDTVGKPPITSWTYADRVVYFEYSTVLHVVSR